MTQLIVLAILIASHLVIRNHTNNFDLTAKNKEREARIFTATLLLGYVLGTVISLI